MASELTEEQAAQYVILNERRIGTAALYKQANDEYQSFVGRMTKEHGELKLTIIGGKDGKESSITKEGK
jgi:hypothetical protein